MAGIMQRFGNRLIKLISGEISAFQTSGSLSTNYKLDSSRVNYTLARELYRNIADKYKLGAGFAKPIVNSTAGFMGIPKFTHIDKQVDQELESFIQNCAGKLFRLNRNTLRDGDMVARIVYIEDKLIPRLFKFDLQLIPPEWVDFIPDTLNGGYMEVSIKYPCLLKDDMGRTDTYYVTEKIRKDKITTIVGDKAPAEVIQLAGEKANPWGFIPVVMFKNEAEEYQVYGISDLEPVEPFMKAYHDTMIFAVQGSRMFSRPKAKFRLNDVEKFLADNFTEAELASGKLPFANKEIFLLQEGDDAAFITADSGTDSITTLLKFLYYCIVDVSETPEFCFGTAVASSKASVSEQMVPFTRKIRRKRGMFEEPYMEMASMYLAMWSSVNNHRLDTYKAAIGWEEISPKNDKEIADTIKTLSEGLVSAVEGGMVSIDAASEFMREFIPSMLPYIDADADDDERRRIAKSMALMFRLRDGMGFEGSNQNPDGGNDGGGTGGGGQ